MANLTYEEVVDTLSDVIEIEIAIRKALSDGLQLSDALVLVQQEPKAKEVINDFPVFAAQFLDLGPDEATKAVEEIKNRIAQNPDVGEENFFILGILEQSALTYKGGYDIENIIRSRIEGWKNLFIAATA